jgi:hypothetical protein
MTMAKRIGILLLAGLIGVVCLALGENSVNRSPGGFVSSADARVGRPLTPVSVAGVARRTARRCAVGVYYC